VAGLLAVMLLTDVRRPARTDPDGRLIPLAEQDRGRWDAVAIAEGICLITELLTNAPIGPYQLQAAIAAVHAEAASSDATDWEQILGLYELLRVMAPGPMVTLNRIVAVAMVHGPQAGLAATGRRRGRTGARQTPPGRCRSRAPAGPRRRPQGCARSTSAGRPSHPKPGCTVVMG